MFFYSLFLYLDFTLGAAGGAFAQTIAGRSVSGLS